MFRFQCEWIRVRSRAIRHSNCACWGQPPSSSCSLSTHGLLFLDHHFPMKFSLCSQSYIIFSFLMKERHGYINIMVGKFLIYKCLHSEQQNTFFNILEHIFPGFKKTIGTFENRYKHAFIPIFYYVLQRLHQGIPIMVQWK